MGALVNCARTKLSTRKVLLARIGSVGEDR